MARDESELRAAKNAYREASNIGNRQEEARWANVIGDIFKRRGEYVEALRWLRIDYEISVKHLPEKHLIPTCQSLGEIYLRLESFEEALNYQKKHLQLAKDIDDLIEQQRASTQLGRTYHEMFYRSEDDHDAVRNSKKYFKLAMKLAQTLKENPPCQKSGFFLKEFIDAHNNLGMLEMDLDNLDEAQQILLEGLKLCDDEEVKEDDDGRSRLHHNLGNLYIELRKWDKAKEHTERDILICKKICHPQGEAKGFINLGELHYRVQKYDDAIICYQRALDIARSMEDEDTLVDQIIQNINTVKEAAKVLKELSKEEQKLKKLTRNAVLARGTPGERKCLLEQNASLDRLIEKSSMIFAWTKHLEFGKRKKRVATELCDKEKLGDSFLAIGESYQKLRNFDKAQKWYMKSWNLYRLIGNLEGQALAKINIGDVLDSAGDWPSALQAFEDGYRLAVQGNLPSVQISALDNMHYSNMIRFDNVEEARRLQQKILDLKSSINGGFKEKNPGNECCSETETEGCDISYTSSDSDISPKINLESSALTRSKGLTSVEELNDDLPLASVIKFCKRPSKKKTSQMDSRGKEPEVSGIPTEHSSQYLKKPVRSQCSVGRKRIRVVLSDDEDAYDEMDHSRERLSIHPVVDMDTSAEVKRRNVSTGPAGGIQDMSLLGAPKDGFSVCTAFHLEESTCSFGSASPVSPKFTVVNGMESRAFSCEKISSAANFVANGSKMDGAHVSGTSLPSQNGMDFLLQSSEGQFVNCITFKMGDNIIHVDASSCMNGDTLSFERMKAELACLYYLGLPEDNRSRGLLPIIRHFKHRGNVLKPFEFVEDFKDIFGRKGVIEVVIGGWVQKRLMKLYIDYCKKLSEAPNMKLLRKLYNLQVSEDEIIVSDCELQDLSVLPFLNALLEHKTIAILDMSHNLLGNETMEKLQQIFISSSQRYGGLTLDLHCNQFGPTALFQICECPVLFARLEVLDLSENRLTDSCASYLSTILENCKVLYSLNLEKCSITSRTIQKVADALNAGSVLSQLYIGKNNPISGNVMSNLLAKLATLKRFSELNLNGVKLSKPAIDSLCQLAKSSCLSRLMLGDTSIGTDGAIQLTEALTSRSQELVKLDLSHCGVISGDFMRLCTNITLMGDILELNLGGNPIGQEGTDSLVPLLTNPGCCLKALILNKCYLGLAGILRIIQAISENNSVEELVLSENVSIDKNTSENGLTAKLFLKSSKHLNLSAVPTEKSASIELRNSQQTLQAQNLDSNGLEAANSKGDEIEKDAILSGPSDSCASSGQPSEESEDSQLFQELSIAIGSAKNLQFLDLSNNGFSTEVAEMLYIAWSSSFRCNGLTQKHIEENIVHFSCEGKQCCGVKICCKRD